MSRVQNLPKQPPHSIEPEQSVLGALMFDAACAITVFGLLSPGDFYRTDHQVIASAIRKLHDKRAPHDVLSVTEFLRDAGEVEHAGGAGYLGLLASDYSSISNVEHYAKIVREKALRRKVIALCADVSDAAYSGQATDLAGMLAGGLEQLLKAGGSQAKKFGDLIGATEDYLRFARERRRAGGTIGVPTGLPSLDKLLSGFCPGRLYGVAARPGMGKTALLNQIAFHAALREQPGLIVSIEMGAEELIIRGLSAYSKSNVGHIFHGYDAECEAALDAARQLGDLPLWIDTDTNSLNAIVAQIAAMKHRHGIKWAAIDHVGLVQTEKFNSRNDQIGHITSTLKRCAKQLQLPLIALFQLSRMSEKENRPPGLHDLRDSGNIEQDLDVAMFLHVEAAHRNQPVRPVKVGILKNRSGQSAWLNGFQFNGTLQTFSEITTDYPQSPYSEAREVAI